MLRVLVLSVLVAVACPFALGDSLSAITRHPTSLVGDEVHWTATQWTSDDAALFDGAPVYHRADKEHRHFILVRYSYYVSQYDADRLVPLWVAHVDHGDALAKAATRTAKHDRKWARIGFYADPNVVEYARANRLPYVIDDCYQNPNPAEFPGPEGTPSHITRGHNASNEEMKLEGDEEAGVLAQHESFSLANVSPQTQGHNAPMWAALEQDCLKWAAKLGKVAVITGPVYRVDPTQPLPVSRIITTHGSRGPVIPIPTHFFKIVIGRIDGQPAAIGFLVPHLNLGREDYRKYAVPIAEIESATSVIFFSNHPNSMLKSAVDNRWLTMLPQHYTPRRRVPRRRRVRQPTPAATLKPRSFETVWAGAYA